MVQRQMPRVQQVVIPLLREGLSSNIDVGSWISDIDYRKYPVLNVRRLGGSAMHPRLFDRPVVELTAMSRDGLVGTENILLDARTVIWNAVEYQTLTSAGYLHSYFETMGPTQFDSKFDAAWRVQMLVRLGLRPLH